jgi:hypothetical protein
MQKGAGDFDAPHLPTRKTANLFVCAIGQSGLPQDLFCQYDRPASADPMKRRVIDQVLLD